MQQLSLTADQAALLNESPASKVDDPEALIAMPLTDAKRLAASEFERRYLIRMMERAGGSVSEGARLAGLDRTNFRRLLQRHSLKERAAKPVAPAAPVAAPAGLAVGQRAVFKSPRGLVYGKVLFLYRYQSRARFEPDAGTTYGGSALAPLDVSLDQIEVTTVGFKPVAI